VVRFCRAAQRVHRRTLGGGGAVKNRSTGHRSPWLPLFETPHHLDQLVDRERFKKLCQSVAEGQSAGAARSFHALVMLELLMAQIPGIRNEILFEAGPDILP